MFVAVVGSGDDSSELASDGLGNDGDDECDVAMAMVMTMHGQLQCAEGRCELRIRRLGNRGRPTRTDWFWLTVLGKVGLALTTPHSDGHNCYCDRAFDCLSDYKN